MTSKATLVLANHRPETISAAQRLMARHDTVIFEAPADPLFMPMLNGQVAIDVSTRGPFAGTIEAVKRFARSDGRFFALRDRLRAAAMVDVIKACGHTYIEAGPSCFPLWHELKRRLPSGYPLAVHFFMADAVRSMGYHGHLYGPGDILTLHYRFHPSQRFQAEDLLAARALIYNKLIAKEEVTDNGIR